MVFIIKTFIFNPFTIDGQKPNAVCSTLGNHYKNSAKLINIIKLVEIMLGK